MSNGTHLCTLTKTNLAGMVGYLDFSSYCSISFLVAVLSFQVSLLSKYTLYASQSDNKNRLWWLIRPLCLILHLGPVLLFKCNKLSTFSSFIFSYTQTAFNHKLLDIDTVFIANKGLVVRGLHWLVVILVNIFTKFPNHFFERGKLQNQHNDHQSNCAHCRH